MPPANYIIFIFLAMWTFEPRLCSNYTSSQSCKMAGTGNDYMGTLSVTRTNRTCQRWLSNEPHTVLPKLLDAKLFADGNLSVVANYCRDPDRTIAGTWCYTTDPLLESDICDVRDCERPQSEGCLIMTNGEGDGREVYIRRQWRGRGSLRFWLKELDPDKPDGIIFELKPRNGTLMYRLVVGAEENSKVILTLHDNGASRVLKHKTLLHLIPTGQWGAFWLRLGEGNLTLGGVEEDEDTTIFRWTGDKPEDVFMPAFMTFISVEGGKIGVAFPCNECHIERTTTKHNTKILPIAMWIENPPAFQRNITFHLRGVGGAFIPLLRHVGQGRYFILTIGEKYDSIFLLKQTPEEGTVDLHEKRLGERVILNDKWTKYFVSFNESHMNVSRNDHLVAEFNSTEPLVFYYFSLIVQRGVITWTANCVPDDIDGDPVDGGWSEFGPFECSVPCGGGTGSMTRNCTAPEPNIFGRDCEGSDRVQGRCNLFPCGDLSPDTVELVEVRLRVTHSSQQAMEGDSVRITLDLALPMERIRTESPTAAWSWTLNSLPLPFNDSRVRLVGDDIHISHCLHTDSGVYACTLQRPSGQRLALSVSALSVLAKAANALPRLRTPFTLICNGITLGHVYSGLRQQWMHEDAVWKDYGLTSVDAVNEDVIAKTRTSDSGIWKCEVSQPDLGFVWVTNIVRIKVRGAPNFLTHLMEDDFTAPFFGLFRRELYVGFFLVGVLIFSISLAVFGVYAYLTFLSNVMDVTLLGHDAKYFPLPQGLKELSSDITREVLRCQPAEIYRFIADYVDAVLMTREKAREAAIIVKDILIHDVTYEAMLLRRGISLEVANKAATIIQAAYRGYVARKMFIGRAWLTAGFDLLAYLRVRGLDPESAAVHVTKIQALYRGHVVRRIMRNTFNFAVGREKSSEKGKELAFYLVGQGVDEEDAQDILDNVLFKYGEFAGEYTTEDETETETETETDASEVEAAPKDGGEGEILEKEGSPLPESSSSPKVVSSSAEPAAESPPTTPVEGSPPKTESPPGTAESPPKSESSPQVPEEGSPPKTESPPGTAESPPKSESSPQVAGEGSPPKTESPPGTAEETPSPAAGDGPQVDDEASPKTEEAPAVEEESLPAAAEEAPPEAAPEETPEPAAEPAEAPAEAPAEEPAAE